MDGYGETALIAWIITFMYIGAFQLGVFVQATEKKSQSAEDEAWNWSSVSHIAMIIGIVIWFIVFW